MIGHIQGVLTSKQPPEVVLDVQGIGYEIQLPMTCFYQLPPVGETIKLITHFVVREDAQLLYGFISASERSLFRLLLKTQELARNWLWLFYPACQQMSLSWL